MPTLGFPPPPKTCFFFETPDLRDVDVVDANGANGKPVVDRLLYEANVNYTFSEDSYMNVF